MKVHFYMFGSDKSRSPRISCNVKLTFVETTDKRRRRLRDAGCLLLGGFVLISAGCARVCFMFCCLILI